MCTTRLETFLRQEGKQLTGAYQYRGIFLVTNRRDVVITTHCQKKIQTGKEPLTKTSKNILKLKRSTLKTYRRYIDCLKLQTKVLTMKQEYKVGYWQLHYVQPSCDFGKSQNFLGVIELRVSVMIWNKTIFGTLSMDSPFTRKSTAIKRTIKIGYLGV